MNYTDSEIFVRWALGGGALIGAILALTNLIEMASVNFIIWVITITGAALTGMIAVVIKKAKDAKRLKADKEALRDGLNFSQNGVSKSNKKTA